VVFSSTSTANFRRDFDEEFCNAMDNSGLVESYESSRDMYESFALALSNLISRLLGADALQMHSVSHRCKTLNSFKLKVEKKGSYLSIGQITDLAGIHLITHYEDDVDKVAQIIESEFNVDRENSIDKRQAIEPEKFGYLSLHYVVSLKPDRTELKEYRSFLGMKAEIQIRSLLQHTWAEIEHDTGYKSDVEVPRHIRRRFSRLAGLLELADQEFIGIRGALEQYSESVASQLSEAASEDRALEEVMIDRVSLQKFYELDSTIKSLDAEICEILQASSGADMSHALEDVARLKLVGVESLGQLKASLIANREFILARAKDVAVRNDISEGTPLPELELRHAISSLYLQQVLAAKVGNFESVQRTLNQMGYKTESTLATSLLRIVHQGH
jgi:putative GTP pyrophosphokinase